MPETTPEIKFNSFREVALEPKPLYEQQQPRFDYSELINALASREAGKPLAVDIPIGVQISSVRSSLYVAAIRVGMNVSVRFMGDQMFISRRDCAKAKRPNTRTQEIVDAISKGEPFRSIAGRFSISHQRVHQIKNAYFLTGIAPSNRRSALLEFVQPYLAHTGVKPCVMCGAELGRQINICKTCKKALSRINRVRTYLRLWKEHDAKQSPSASHLLIQAVHEIRKYGIAPEHLAPVGKAAKLEGK